MTLTPKQDEVYRFIRSYLRKHDLAPTEAEIAEGIGIKSRGVVHRYVSALVDEGLLETIPGKRRNIRLADNDTAFALPLMGKIAAGLPIEAVEDDAIFDLGAQIMGRRRFLLKVKGNSMINEGIFDGDYVICEKTEDASNGQIVVAMVDNEEATLKRYYHNEDGSVSLFPANAAYSPMVFDEERVKVIAIYKGLFRFE
tara:strand:- start:191 stop:784 length:594 start_codon:yes stop_codon:yes gene_type:complete